LDDIRFNFKYWQQIAQHMAKIQEKPFAIVKHPLNGEYFTRSLNSALDFKNEIVWNTDQFELDPALLLPMPLELPMD
jgi:hypothetical protein